MEHFLSAQYFLWLFNPQMSDGTSSAELPFMYVWKEDEGLLVNPTFAKKKRRRVYFFYKMKMKNKAMHK